MGEIELGAAAEATIQAYRELASDPGKRLALALDRTCIQFLAYVIAEGEASLVRLAIETLSLIAQAKECRPSLANTFGVLESLQAVTEDEENYSEDLRDQAAGLFTSLQFARCVKKTPSPDKPVESSASSSCTDVKKQRDDVDSSKNAEEEKTPKHKSDVDSSKNAEEEKTPKHGSVSSMEPTESASGSPNRSPKKSDESESSRRCSSVDSRSSMVDESSRSTNPNPSVEKKNSFLGPNNSKAKIVTLFIKGMVDPEHRKQVEDELVRVRGLISIVFDLGHSRVTCRVKRDLSVEKLAAAVARTETWSAQQVTTNPNGEEVIVPLGGDVSATTSPVDDLPDYLPEEDIDVKDSNSAMAPSGNFKEAASSWFTAASSLLQKSFYW